MKKLLKYYSCIFLIAISITIIISLVYTIFSKNIISLMITILLPFIWVTVFIILIIEIIIDKDKRKDDVNGKQY